MQGREYELVAESGYRYGFNGKEKMPEVTSNGYDFGARVYDARIAKWMSVDPLQAKYPGETPYFFAGGNPIIYADIDGRDRILRITVRNQDGTLTKIERVDYSKFKYTKSNVYGGGVKYYRSSEIIELTIDNFSGVDETISAIMNNPSTSVFKLGSQTFDEESISGIAYYFHEVFGSPTNDSHEKSKIGVFTYGKGLNPEWQKMHEMGAEGSESLDLGSLLDVLGSIGPSNSPAGIYNEIVQKWFKKTGRDMDQVIVALGIIVKGIDGAAEAVDNGSTAVETVNKLNNNSPGLGPGQNSTVDTIPETRKKKDDCSVCHLKNMDSSHVNQVARKENERRRKVEKTQ